MFLFPAFLLGLALPIILNCIIAKKFEKIAFQKGYTKSIHSFAMCFWFGIVGYIYVAALPNLAQQKVTEEIPTNTATTTIAANAPSEYICPTCKSVIAKDEKFCHKCGQEILWDR